MILEKVKIPELESLKNNAVFVIGPPGSGKSFIVANKLSGKFVVSTSKTELSLLRLYNGANYKIFNSDVISKILNNGNETNRIKGSSNLTKLYLLSFIKSNNNFIYETTGNEIKFIEELIEKSINSGYNIIILYVQASLDNIYARISNRIRPVDSEYVEETLKNIPHNFQILLNKYPDIKTAYLLVNDNNDNLEYKKIK